MPVSAVSIIDLITDTNSLLQDFDETCDVVELGLFQDTFFACSLVEHLIINRTHSKLNVVQNCDKPVADSSVANLVSEILDLVSPKDLVNLVSEKHNFSSWLRRDLATLADSHNRCYVLIRISGHFRRMIILNI